MTDTRVRSSGLYTMHHRALMALHADLENHALGQAGVFIGTPGSVIERANASGFRFYAHQYYDGDGKKRESYLAGPMGEAGADGAAEAMRTRIREAQQVAQSLRTLGREGFNVVDAKTYATLAALYNHGVFVAGAVLIGSHAYGMLLNQLGARGTPYATEDIDIARREALALTSPHQGLLDMLRDSGIAFVEVPQLDRKAPATSFKQSGRSRFRLDLLVPSPNETFPVVAVPELGAHATGLPYLDYLLAESQPALLMGRQGCFGIRVPLPERFAIHKLIVSRLRVGRGAKSDKDVYQACVLAAVLAEEHPGAIPAAAAGVPSRARKHLRSAIESARKHLESGHPRAWEELSAD